MNGLSMSDITTPVCVIISMTLVCRLNVSYLSSRGVRGLSRISLNFVLILLGNCLVDLRGLLTFNGSDLCLVSTVCDTHGYDAKGRRRNIDVHPGERRGEWQPVA